MTKNADTDPVKHMRLAAIQRCRPIIGTELVAAWAREADQYPDELVTAMVSRTLNPGALPGWSAREALAGRGDEIALHHLLVSVQQAVLGALMALNRIYAQHRLAKWQRWLLAELDVAPDRLAERLHILISAASATQAIEEAESLLIETTELAEQQTGADLAKFRNALADRRNSYVPDTP